MVTPDHEDWRRTGVMLARYQNRFGHVEPGDHQNDILILLAAERLGAELLTENGDHFRIWSRFRPPERRPSLVVLNRAEHTNAR